MKTTLWIWIVRYEGRYDVVVWNPIIRRYMYKYRSSHKLYYDALNALIRVRENNTNIEWIRLTDKL